MENIPYTIKLFGIFAIIALIYFIINWKENRDLRRLSRNIFMPMNNDISEINKNMEIIAKSPLYSKLRCECGNPSEIQNRLYESGVPRFCKSCNEIFKAEYSKFKNKQITCFCGCDIIPGSIYCSIHLQLIVDSHLIVAKEFGCYCATSNKGKCHYCIFKDSIKLKQILLNNYFNNLNPKQNMENNFEFKEHKEPIQESLDIVSQVEQEYKGNKNQHIPIVEKSRLTIKVEKTNTGYSCYTKEVDGLYTVGADMVELHDNYFEVLQYHCDYSNEQYDSKITINDFKLLWVLSHEVMLAETIGKNKLPNLDNNYDLSLLQKDIENPLLTDKPKSEMRRLLDQVYEAFKINRDKEKEKQFVGGFDKVVQKLDYIPKYEGGVHMNPKYQISDDRKSIAFKVPVNDVSMNDAIEILQNQKDNFDAEFQWNKDTNELQIYQDPNKIVDVNKLADGGKRLETLKKAIESGAAYIQDHAIRGPEPLEINYPLKVQSAGNYGISANENGGLEINPIFKIEHKNPIYLANFHIDENGILKHGFKYNDLETHPGFSEAILTHEEVDQTKDTDDIQQKQYDLRSFRTDNNNFEWSEKVYQDTTQFFASVLGPEKFERWGNVADDGHPDYNPELYKSLDQLVFPIGTKLHLEVEVTNIWFSRMLSMWLYGQSEYSNADISKDVFIDNKFEPMGLHLHNVNWYGLHTLNGFERDSLQTAINIIQSKLDKDNANKNINVTL